MSSCRFVFCVAGAGWVNSRNEILPAGCQQSAPPNPGQWVDSAATVHRPAGKQRLGLRETPVVIVFPSGLKQIMAGSDPMIKHPERTGESNCPPFPSSFQDDLFSSPSPDTGVSGLYPRSLRDGRCSAVRCPVVPLAQPPSWHLGSLKTTFPAGIVAAAGA